MKKKIGAIPGMKPERNRATTGMKPSSLGKQPQSIFWSLHGHYDATARSLRFGFVNGSSFEPRLGSFWLLLPDSLRFEFKFYEWLKFSTQLGSFWS